MDVVPDARFILFYLLLRSYDYECTACQFVFSYFTKLRTMYASNSSVVLDYDLLQVTLQSIQIYIIKH